MPTTANLEKLLQIKQILEDENIPLSQLKTLVETLVLAIKKSVDENKSLNEQARKDAEQMIQSAQDSLISATENLTTDQQVLKQEILDYLESYKQEIEQKTKQLTDNLLVKSDLQLQAVVDEVKSLKPEDGKDANPEDVVPLVLEKIKLPETFDLTGKGQKIIEEINSTGLEFKIDASHIKGLDKFVGTQKFIGGGIVGRDLIKDIDLSDQLNGVTKTFNIQAVWNIVSVSLSSYPYGALRKGIDYTWTPTSITFTDEISADIQLAVGQKCILTIIQS